MLVQTLFGRLAYARLSTKNTYNNQYHKSGRLAVGPVLTKAGAAKLFLGEP
jgi:hypothetical protein